MIGAAMAFFTGGSFTRLAATLLAGLVLGGWGAWQVQAWRADRINLQRSEQAAKDLHRAIEQQDRAVAAYITEQADEQAKIQRITVEVDKIVERPVYVQRCLDDDGMRLLRAAIRSGGPEPGPGAAVPADR